MQLITFPAGTTAYSLRERQLVVLPTFTTVAGTLCEPTHHGWATGLVYFFLIGTEGYEADALSALLPNHPPQHT
jgi:hypothetical protein